MTISNTANAITVQGDGLTTTFSYDFYMASSTNAVLVRQDASGAEEQISAAAFSITGVTSSSGGTFTYPLAGAAITAGESLTLYRIIAETQDASIGNQGNFYPTVVEGALDKLTMLVQQVTPEGDYGVPFLAGNPTLVPGVFRQIELGSGLTFSGNVISVSGVSGSGSVTQINTGTGITGGPITGVGTVSLSTFTSGFVLANFSGGDAAPVPVQLVAGAGLTFSASTTSLTITASGTVVLISTVTTSGATSSALFSGIAATYRDLELRVHGRGTTATDFVNLALRFNGDTGANYGYINVIWNTSVGAQAGAGGQTSVLRIADLPAANATAGYAGLAIIDIGEYAGTAFFKQATCRATTRGSDFLVEVGGGFWASTSAISSVLAFVTTGAFVNGSVLSLYGRY